MKPVNQGLSPYSRILSQKMLLEKVETSKFNNPRNMLECVLVIIILSKDQVNFILIGITLWHLCRLKENRLYINAKGLPQNVHSFCITQNAAGNSNTFWIFKRIHYIENFPNLTFFPGMWHEVAFSDFSRANKLHIKLKGSNEKQKFNWIKLSERKGYEYEWNEKDLDLHTKPKHLID